MASEKISQLQLLEQGMQSFNMQKQQLQANILEFESALEELDNTDASYKIIGNIMVKVDQDKLKKSLEEDKKNAEIRIKAVEKQEDSMKEKAKRIQQEVMEEMKNNG
ncbi:prefoldin subunit [Candidatus Woesearchaeota archaeon]|nr:prefoldin subunit [Candidatus Woesearchaeota archaeon]